MFSHIFIGVSDFSRALAFYNPLMGFLPSLGLAVVLFVALVTLLAFVAQDHRPFGTTRRPLPMGVIASARKAACASVYQVSPSAPQSSRSPGGKVSASGALLSWPSDAGSACGAGSTQSSSGLVSTASASSASSSTAYTPSPAMAGRSVTTAPMSSPRAATAWIASLKLAMTRYRFER